MADINVCNMKRIYISNKLNNSKKWEKNGRSSYQNSYPYEYEVRGTRPRISLYEVRVQNLTRTWVRDIRPKLGVFRSTSTSKIEIYEHWMRESKEFINTEVTVNLALRFNDSKIVRAMIANSMIVEANIRGNTKYGKIKFLNHR